MLVPDAAGHGHGPPCPLGVDIRLWLEASGLRLIMMITVEIGDRGSLVDYVDDVSPVFVAFLSHLLQVSGPINNSFISN